MENNFLNNANTKPNNVAMEAILFDNNVVIITKDSFEHLLNCLANQKFTNYQEDLDTQNIIDDFWNQGMNVICPPKSTN